MALVGCAGLRGQQAASLVRFNGQVADRHTTQDGSQYLHLTLEADSSRDPARMIDAEFLFLSGAHLPLCLDFVLTPCRGKSLHNAICGRAGRLTACGRLAC